MVVAVGRLKAGPERELAARYSERFGMLARNLGLDGPHVQELEESRARRPDDRMAEEARAIFARLPPAARILALDGRGEVLDSAALAADIAHSRDIGTPSLAVIIGGPDGLAENVRRDAHRQIALGRLTWPHQLVRVMVAEQLYRAATIIAGHPYHRE